MAGWLGALPVRRTPAKLQLVASGYCTSLCRSLPLRLNGVLPGVLPYRLYVAEARWQLTHRARQGLVSDGTILAPKEALRGRPNANRSSLPGLLPSLPTQDRLGLSGCILWSSGAQRFPKEHVTHVLCAPSTRLFCRPRQGTSTDGLAYFLELSTTRGLSSALSQPF